MSQTRRSKRTSGDSVFVRVREDPETGNWQECVSFLSGIGSGQLQGKDAEAGARQFIAVIRHVLDEAQPVRLTHALSEHVRDFWNSPAKTFGELLDAGTELLKPENQERLVNSLKQRDATNNRPEKQTAIGFDIFGNSLNQLAGMPIIPSTPEIRAVRAGVLSFVLYQKDIIALIDQASQGDRQSVLDLIKLDKMFLHDPCTEKVIRMAECAYDRAFLDQVSRAIIHPRNRRKSENSKMGASGKRKIKERVPDQAVFYLLEILGNPFPSEQLYFLLDPHESTYSGSEAFRKNLKRWKDEMRSIGVGAGNVTMDNGDSLGITENQL